MPFNKIYGHLSPHKSNDMSIQRQQIALNVDTHNRHGMVISNLHWNESHLTDKVEK